MFVPVLLFTLVSEYLISIFRTTEQMVTVTDGGILVQMR